VNAKSSANFQVRIKTGRHEFIADEPPGNGNDAGPDPYSLLLICLAAMRKQFGGQAIKRKSKLSRNTCWGAREGDCRTPSALFSTSSHFIIMRRILTILAPETRRIENV
jgi:uncharacterized OsmC-like protein